MGETHDAMRSIRSKNYKLILNLMPLRPYCQYSSYNDFKKYGYPAWYPTRTLEEWEKALAAWRPYVFREPAEQMKRPSVLFKQE